MPAGEALEVDDIQGLVFRGYGGHPCASYHLLSLRGRALGAGWLAAAIDRVPRGKPAPGQGVVHLAFTHSGLERLGLSPDALAGFSVEFIQGMAEPNRSRELGDQGGSAPDRWAWGGPRSPEVDLLLLLYAPDAKALHAMQKTHREGLAPGWEEVATLETELLDAREHFGFADGISQPAVEGYHEASSPQHAIKPGEFLLGYKNEYGLYTDRPLVSPKLDPGGLLPEDVEGSGRRDLGRNGTYLVLRQLLQDVAAFRSMLEEQSRGPDGTPDPAAAAKLAARMLGRWPSGASLVVSPDADDPSRAQATQSNDFLYHPTDPEGHRCPFGAHVRRANPRDSLEPDPGSEESIAVGKRHRLLRRGRKYGPPLADGAQAKDGDGVERGIHFICLNANLSRQFEFVQHTWLNNPKFNGLYGDADPIVGAREDNQFTVQASPVRKRYRGLGRFVSVAGGAYFFLPGIRALRYLASIAGGE